MTSTLLFYLAGFGITALAADTIGRYFTQYRMPLITGYLLTGILVGPFGLDLVSRKAAEELRFVDEISLAVIAFAAGSELYLKELLSRLKSIFWVTFGSIAAIYVVVTITMLAVADYIPFMQDMSLTNQFAIAILAGAILVARSPSSAIAIINELRARGPFTKTVLGVTVVIDALVIVFFAFNASVADALLTDVGFNLGFILLLAIELSLSFGAGYLLGLGLRLLLATHWHQYVKIAFILTMGYLVFVGSEQVRHYTHEHWENELLLEPLLICMIAGFVVTNYGDYRTEFMRILHVIEPAIFVVFFTHTGSLLELDVVAKTWPIALALFSVRLMGSFAGALAGGYIAGEPMRHNRLAWMAYITQAGIGLGLAKEVAVEFPEWGNEFATVIISVIVLNQLVGPPFFKAVIKRVGEAHLPPDAEPDRVRDAVILGIEGKSLALARVLMEHNWQVIVADIDPLGVERVTDDGIAVHHLPEVSNEALARIMNSSTDVLVALLHDDEDNLRACQIAYEQFGVKRIVALINDQSKTRLFQDVGASVVNPASAIINLLDQFVRAPQSARLLLHRVEDYDTAQVTVVDEDIIGLTLREIRLPDDILVLSIQRDGHSIVPRGYTKLQRGDEVTLLGEPDSIADVTRRLGF